MQSLKNEKRHLCFQFRNYNIDNIDNIDGAFDCFKITLFLRLYTLRQLVLLFNYHITHAVNLNGKKTPAKSKFSNLCKMLVILICNKVSNE